MNTIEKSYSAKWGLGRWVALFAGVVAIATIATWHITAPNDEITSTVSKPRPSIERDGTSARPYADASQCPPSTDVVIWPNDDRPIPSIPPDISVCVVATQSLNDAGPDRHVGDR